MSKGFWAIIVAIIVIVGGIIIFSNNGKSNGSSNQATSHIEGHGSAGVTLVEYGDYQCPFCEQYFATVKQVASEFNQQIKFQFRNFPLTSIHQHAFEGARAAEAADLQGKFWEMHDMLYQDQETWVNASNPESVFDSYAQQLGLNVTKFKQDFSSDTVNNRINADLAAGNKLGITGTPTFYLDGKVIQPGVFDANDLINAPVTLANFEKDINAEITKKTGKASNVTSTTSSSSSTTTTPSNVPTQSKQ